MLISNRDKNKDRRPPYNLPITKDYKIVKNDKSGGVWYFNPIYQHYYYRPVGMNTLVRPSTNSMYDYTFEIGVAHNGSFNYDMKSGSYYYQPINKEKIPYSEIVKQRQYMTPEDFHAVAKQTPALMSQNEVKQKSPWIALEKEGWFFNNETGNYGYRPIKQYSNPFGGKSVTRRSTDDNDMKIYTPQQMQQQFGYRDTEAERQTTWNYLGKDTKTNGLWYLNPINGEYAYKIGGDTKYFTKQQMLQQFGRAPESNGYTEIDWASPPKLNFTAMEFADLNYQKQIAETQLQTIRNYTTKYKNYLNQKQIEEINNKSKEWFMYYSQLDKALNNKSQT